MSMKTTLLTGAAFGLASLAMASPAHAQAGASSSSSGGTIIVSARKRDEDIQDVPIAITALSEKDLNDANAFGLEDVAELTPGLNFRQVGGISDITIRGLSQTDLLGLQANVGVFIDGIFLNNRSSVEFANMDLARVEVLKGPQSSLFGRNTFAGAINYVTNPAQMGEFSGRVEGQVGSHDRVGVKGSVNVPVGDFGGVRFFGGYSEFDGTIENERGGDNLGGWDKRATYGVNGRFEFGPVTLSGMYLRNEVEEDSQALRSIPFTQNNGGTEYEVPDGMGGTRTLFSINTGPFQPLESVSIDRRAFGNDGYFELIYGNVDIDLGFATLTGNISTSESSYDAFFDNVGDPDAINRPFFFIYTDQFLTDQTGDVGEQDSYEVRLASNEASPFDWLIGYSRYESTTGSVLGTTTPLFADPTTLERLTNVESRLSVDVDAFFAAVNVPLGEAVNVYGEVRYTEEKQQLSDLAEIFFFPPLGRPLSTTNNNLDYWTGKIGADFDITPDIMLYAYAAKGVKSGGINPPDLGRPTFNIFDAETNWTYETGMKSTLWDGRALLNIALFYVDWTDLQSTAPASLARGPVTVNGSGASSKGIEVDASIDITDNFNLRLAGSYADATYDDDFVDGSVEARCGVTAAPTVDVINACSAAVGGNQIANSSDTSFFAAATYTVPEVVFDLDAFIRASYSYEAGRFVSSLNQIDTGDINLANLRLGLRDDMTEIAFWVDNVFDEEYFGRITSVTSVPAGQLCAGCGISDTTLIAANGRTWGVTVSREF